MYLVALCGTCDELAVGLFPSEAEAVKFITDNPPAPVEGCGCVNDGPLYDAFVVRGCGPSLVLGYVVTKFEDGKPVSVALTRWGRVNYDDVFVENDPFDPLAPLFSSPQEEWSK